ncbi:hypothetical protein [Clostridium sp. YIM B02500]|uniref:hypothetical protein n=1 Tax=Clostridium sp. YIM B02500 TaxID=2910681 RepID=UPI001EED6272|nr:hypothetical protein [Clostridium sp. YIM B02500]
MAKKLELWEKELPPDKITLLAYLAKKTKDEEAAKEVDRQMADIKNGLTTSIRAALFELYDFSLEEIEQVIVKSNEYLKEKEKFLEKWGMDFMDKIKELEPKIKEEILRLTKGMDPKKINRLEIVKKVQKEFDIPLDNANEIFLMVKETEFPELSNKKHTPKKYLKQNSNNGTKEDIKNQPILEQKETSNVITPKEENKSVEKQIDKQKQDVKSIFEVVEKTIILKTPNGIYEKIKDGVAFGGRLYISIDDVKAHKKDILDRDEERKIKVIKEIEKLQNELHQIDENEKLIKIRTEEIIAAFAYEG